MIVSSGKAPEPEPNSYSAPKITRGHSCILCQQRKVRCDRQKPCSNCIKARAECVQSTPTLPRRRRKKATDTDLMAKIRRYEQLLKTHGLKTEEDGEEGVEEGSVDPPHEFTPNRDYGGPSHQSITMAVPRAPNAETGALFTNKGESHYVEK